MAELATNIIEVIRLNKTIYKADELVLFRPVGQTEFIELSAREIRDLLNNYKEVKIYEEPEDNH